MQVAFPFETCPHCTKKIYITYEQSRMLDKYDKVFFGIAGAAVVVGLILYLGYKMNWLMVCIGAGAVIGAAYKIIELMLMMQIGAKVLRENPEYEHLMGKADKLVRQINADENLSQEEKEVFNMAFETISKHRFSLEWSTKAYEVNEDYYRKKITLNEYEKKVKELTNKYR
jgi:hypothetical protein